MTKIEELKEKIKDMEVLFPDAVKRVKDMIENSNIKEMWGLDYDAYLFNVVKYVARAGKKDDTKELEDLKKAAFYLDRKIKNLEK